MGGKSGGGEAAQARADEQERQARIRAGTERVNGIFDGGVTGTGRLDAAATFDPNGVYYRADGTRWTPTQREQAVQKVAAPDLTGGKGDTPASAAPQDDSEQQFREALSGGLYSGTSSTGGFNDDFFAGRRKAFLDYATPQLDDQYADANRQLTYSLSRSGLLDSSVRADKAAELQKQYDLNKQQIADQALSYESESRNNVESARSDLIAMLNATGDAEGAVNSATARSQALSAPQAFSPLSQLFSDFTAGLGAQAASERANAAAASYGLPSSGRYNTGLFSNSRSVSVTR